MEVLLYTQPYARPNLLSGLKERYVCQHCTTAYINRITYILCCNMLLVCTWNKIFPLGHHRYIFVACLLCLPAQTNLSHKRIFKVKTVAGCAVSQQQKRAWIPQRSGTLLMTRSHHFPTRLRMLHY